MTVHNHLDPVMYLHYSFLSLSTRHTTSSSSSSTSHPQSHPHSHTQNSEFSQNDQNKSFSKMNRSPSLISITNITELLDTVLVVAITVLNNNGGPLLSTSIPIQKKNENTVKSAGISRKITTRVVKASALADRILSLQHGLLILLFLITRSVCSTENDEFESVSQVINKILYDRIY